MVQETRSTLRSEAFAFGELAQLMADPIFYGVGAPRGDGRNVVVLPGLFGSDVYLYPLRTWLGRIGYRAVQSTLRMNVGCPERLRTQIAHEIERKSAAGNDKPIALVGHSRGGLLARAIAADLCDRASHLILLGSPVSALSRTSIGIRPGDRAAPPVAPLVAEAGLRARNAVDPQCRFPACGCPFPEDLRTPLSVHTTVASIFSRNDPIVPARACRVAGAENIEVGGTHSGLVYNGSVYRNIARILGER